MKVLYVGENGGGGSFTPVYGGYYQTTDVTVTTTISAINTTYNVDVDTIAAVPNSTGTTVVPGGGLRNTSGSTGVFRVRVDIAGGWWSGSRFFDLGARIRQTDDTTYDAMVTSSHGNIYASSQPTSPGWTVYLTVQNNETVFPCVEQTSSTAANIAHRGIQMTMERIA